MRKKIFFRKLVQLLFFCCMLLTSLGTFAQSSITIKGQVVDETTSEPLIGVSILEKGINKEPQMVSLPTLTVISVSRLPSIQLL